jgi:hypothetical protein
MEDAAAEAPADVYGILDRCRTNSTTCHMIKSTYCGRAFIA